MANTHSSHPFASTVKGFETASGKSGQLFSLPVLTEQFPNIKRLPRSIRIVLESVLRNCDGRRITREHVEQVANWQAHGARTDEVPFTVARVLLQDFTGVPLLVDLAAMRSAAQRLGKDPKKIEPMVPVDLVVDHSITVDHYGNPSALALNMETEFKRNRERYEFMKWGMQAFDTFRVVPPGFGICHQVNLEYLSKLLHKTADGVYYPDTLVGTDSHTPMINGIGVVGWGVGGIEAEAAMLGQPMYMLAPDVVGFELKGSLREGCTATDLVLTVTELLRKHKVVGKFVEYFGQGTGSLSVPDRATLGNMSPENGSTIGLFPVDERTLEYLRDTGRTDAEVEAVEAYYKAQDLFGAPAAGEIEYSQVVTLDLSTVTPSIAGPRRPQDRINLDSAAQEFKRLYSVPMEQGGFARPADTLDQRITVQSNGDATGFDTTAPAMPEGASRSKAEMEANKPHLPATHSEAADHPRETPASMELGNGDIVIAAITSCTNTSNPSVMLAAGLLARKAVDAGLTIGPRVKTSLAPGSRIVTDYLVETGLQPYLDKLGFNLVGYGCTTCIGNSGDLSPEFNDAINKHELVCASVLSGNRNFEARIHPNVKANFLMSPPLVVAYAIAGNMMVDLLTEPLGKGKNGQDVFLRDVWPTMDEVEELLKYARNGDSFRAAYGRIETEPGQLWESIHGVTGEVYDWPASTYIAEPPFFEDFSLDAASGSAGARYSIHGARVMALFGDSVTTDHISPAGRIGERSPAGRWLIDNKVAKPNFNSYGSRRGNHEVMMRGTFANVRIKNLMIPAKADGSREEGGYTLAQPSGEKTDIFDAAMNYIDAGVPSVVFAGEEYGSGSSRDWAAKGTQLLGIKAVVARSYERIHRSNLVGMGVLPLQFNGDDSWASLGLKGDELVDIQLPSELKPLSQAELTITRADGSKQQTTLTLRIDTPIEVDYFRVGGILPYVLQQLVS